MKINKESYDVDVFKILIDLREYFEKKGISRFEDIKETQTDYMITCPFHSNGMESHPSCGVNKESGIFHCFTCGYTGTLDKTISRILGFEDNGEKGLDWIRGNYTQILIETREGLKLFNTIKDKLKKEKTYITEEELDTYRYIHPYMYKRKLTDEIIEKFDIGYDSSCQCLTFPVWDENGNCVFVGRRSVNTKYFNYPSGAEKPVYLLNFIIKDNITKVYVCESFINALTLWSWGYPAIALIGLGSSYQYNILNKSNIRGYVLCLDGDNAGRNATKKFEQNIKNAIFYEKSIPDKKDVNDLTKEEFDNLLEKRI